MENRVDSPRAVLCGDKELYHFVVELKDEPGTLVQVLSVFDSYGLNLVNLYTTESNYEERRETTEVNLFVDFTGTRFSPEQVVKSLSLLNVVKQARYYGKQLPNMIVDGIHFPTTIMGERIIIYREHSYTALIHGIRRQLGTGGEALLYHIGYNIGKGSGVRLKKLLQGRYDLVGEYLKYWMLIHSAALITEIKIDIDKKKVLIRAQDNYECKTGLNHGKPFSHLFRGNLAGILEEILGIRTLVETKCIAAGDPYCEFVTPEE